MLLHQGFRETNTKILHSPGPLVTAEKTEETGPRHHPNLGRPQIWWHDVPAMEPTKNETIRSVRFSVPLHRNSILNWLNDVFKKVVTVLMYPISSEKSSCCFGGSNLVHPGILGPTGWGPKLHHLCGHRRRSTLDSTDWSSPEVGERIISSPSCEVLLQQPKRLREENGAKNFHASVCRTPASICLKHFMKRDTRSASPTERLVLVDRTIHVAFPASTYVYTVI